MAREHSGWQSHNRWINLLSSCRPDLSWWSVIVEWVHFQVQLRPAVSDSRTMCLYRWLLGKQVRPCHLTLSSFYQRGLETRGSSFKLIGFVFAASWSQAQQVGLLFWACKGLSLLRAIIDRWSRHVWPLCNNNRSKIGKVKVAVVKTSSVKIAVQFKSQVAEQQH